MTPLCAAQWPIPATAAGGFGTCLPRPVSWGQGVSGPARCSGGIRPVCRDERVGWADSEDVPRTR